LVVKKAKYVTFNPTLRGMVLAEKAPEVNNRGKMTAGRVNQDTNVRILLSESVYLLN
jgi:hypothetical protein